MTKTNLYILPCLLALLCTACSSDDIIEKQPTQLLQMVTSSVSALQEPVAARATSRGTFVPGTGSSAYTDGVPNFHPYNELYPMPTNKDYTTIGAFLAEDTRNEYTSLAGYFRYEGDNKWSSTVGIKDQTNNFIFGYMPSNTGQTLAQIDKRTGDGTTNSWADGAKMTLRDLPAATPADVCVVVGVLKAAVPNPKPVGWAPLSIDHDDVVSQLRQGVYGYEGTAEDNYVYLLLEHIYANINVELSIDPEYAKLRTIVLTDVRVKVVLPSHVNCEMELCNDPKKPIKEIRFDNGSGTESLISTRLFSDNERMVLSTTPKSVPVYFSPYLPDSGFDYEFHYNVYDKEGEDLSDPENPIFGNLVREDCVANNHWSIKGYPVEAGKSFKANVKVKPTYLFMLSEPDLDNPTFVLKVTPQP